MELSLLVIAVVFFIGLYLIKHRRSSPIYKGKVGEEWVHNILMELPDEYYVMDDVVLRTEKGTTQIDHIVISKYAVFVIETKNYSGEIFGDDNNKEWTQRIVSEVTYSKKWYKTYTYVTKNQFYNPVKQSLGHMYEVRKIVEQWPYLNIIPIVVFAGSANISNVNTKNHVVYDNDLLKTILSYKTIYLSDSDLQKVVEKLSLLNSREFVDNATHIKNIKVAKNEMNNKVAAGICPLCGGKLVERSGKFGSFYGCSNYPKCKFTTH